MKSIVSDWKQTCLGDVVKFVGGAQPPKNEFITMERDGYIRLLQIRDYKTDQYKTYIPLKMARRFCSKEDIMIGRYGPPVFQILRGLEGSYNVALMKAEPDNVLHKDFLYHFLKQDKLFKLIDGLSQRTAGQSGVDMDALKGYPMLLPPLVEQNRIAAILDAADALRAKRRESLAQLDTLLQSTFIDMFGDPVTNPKGWDENVQLGTLAEIVSGITKGRKINGKTTREVKYLAVANVQDRHLSLDFIKTIEATEDEIERYRLVKNDLLLTEGGDPDKLGRGSLWQGEISECIHQNHVFRVRLKDERLHPVFLNWIVGSTRGKKYFLRSAKQTTGIASINMTQLKAFPVLAPPFDLQRRFATIVESIEQQKTRMRAHLEELDTLFASLQHRAFNGEL